MNIFFFFFKHIPFEVNVASGFQVYGSEVVIVWFIGLGVEAIEILLPLLLCKQMSLPYSPQLPLSPSVPSCLQGHPQLHVQGSTSECDVLCQH